LKELKNYGGRERDNMGKRIIQQRRGRGGHTYKVREKASRVRPGYLTEMKGEWTCVKLISSPGHSIPLAKFVNESGKTFVNFACDLLYVGQKIKIGGNNYGDIAKIGDLKNGTRVFNLEHNEGDGGKFVRTGGNFAEVMAKEGDVVKVMMPSKRTKKFGVNVRATVGRAAGEGRVAKPVLKAGKKFFIMKMKSKLWPRTSAVAMNAIDHPVVVGVSV
jgi:large subunit ribosomal protein L2